MLFNSYIFVFLFLPLAVLGYYGLRRKGTEKTALVFLFVMSMWFYGYNSIKYLIILVISIAVNYAVVWFIMKTGNTAKRRILLITGITINLSILFYFKYYDFFIENVNAVLETDYGFLRLALPLGISFYTFQQLSYVIDAYKNESGKYSFIEYASYVTFFPQLIAGPIVYHDELIPQLKNRQNHKPNYENLSKGIYAFSLGLAKKVLIADTFSKIVNVGYGNIQELNTTSVIIVLVCYSLQIYFDFSGYCDMAYGIGFMFNVELPVNFNSPYKAESITEFWDRWHMTLTRFFTKYIYIPLGGSRKGNFRTYLNVMSVFLISGIWHGANWTFILWGCINGIGNIFDRVFGKFFRWIPHALKVLITFSLCTLAWGLFRASSIEQAQDMFKHLLKFENPTIIYSGITDSFNSLLEVDILERIGFDSIITSYPWIVLVTFTVIVLIGCFFMRNTQEKVKDGRYGTFRIVSTVFLLIWSILSMSGVSEFLYFNF